MPKSDTTRYPLSSFSSKILDVLLRGARERVEIPCPDQRTMQRLQARIHMMRAAMRREHHPQSAIVSRARTSRTWDRGQPNTNCILVIQPHDAEFDAVFKAAGITPSPHATDLLADIGEPTAPLVPDDDTGASAPDPYAKFKGDDHE